MADTAMPPTGGRDSLRRRRPSGEPAPLPKEPLAGSGKAWTAVALAVAGLFALLLSPTELFLGSGAWWNSVDAELTGWFVTVRTSLLTDVALVIDEIRTDWFVTALRWGTVAALVGFRRWRHLIVFVGAVIFTDTLVVGLSNRLARPRADGVEILTDWSGFAQPSHDAAALTVTLVAMVYALVVPGRPRRSALISISVVLTILGLARVYLAADRVTDYATAMVIGVTVPLMAYRLATPDAVYPVSYRRGKTAHLDLSGRRRAAMVAALRDQLGIEVAGIEQFGLEGSGGSTPLRISVLDGGYVFAKLYAKNHLRSDRWYKLGRTILYGALEDESAFRTVRRLAEHEDHVMRLMVEAGVPCPAPLGIVEITPGREYLLVTEFLEGVSELSDGEITHPTIDAALWTVSKMWDSGLAHRDIKPANILVGSERVYLIDHAFGEMRPSPWRQAIDLANMLLALSIHSPPKVVYERASEHFSQMELAEAFAATRGVTIPGELRQAMRDRCPEALREFRSLAPPHPPIRIQRWTRRRLLVLVVLALSAAAAVWLVALNRSIVGQLL